MQRGYTPWVDGFEWGASSSFSSSSVFFFLSASCSCSSFCYLLLSPFVFFFLLLSFLFLSSSSFSLLLQSIYLLLFLVVVRLSVSLVSLPPSPWPTRAGFSLVLSTLWPFLQSMHGSQSFFGWVVAGYSLGQFVASPLFGWLSTKLRTRTLLVVALSIGIVSNVAYSFSDSLPSGQTYFMLATRIVVGISAGAAEIIYLCVVLVVDVCPVCDVFVA